MTADSNDDTTETDRTDEQEVSLHSIGGMRKTAAHQGLNQLVDAYDMTVESIEYSDERDCYKINWPKTSEYPLPEDLAIVFKLGAIFGSRLEIEFPDERNPDDADCALCGDRVEQPTLTTDSHPEGPNLVVCQDCTA